MEHRDVQHRTPPPPHMQFPVCFWLLLEHTSSCTGNILPQFAVQSAKMQGGAGRAWWPWGRKECRSKAGLFNFYMIASGVNALHAFCKGKYDDKTACKVLSIQPPPFPSPPPVSTTTVTM